MEPHTERHSKSMNTPTTPNNPNVEQLFKTTWTLHPDMRRYCLTHFLKVTTAAQLRRRIEPGNNTILQGGILYTIHFSGRNLERDFQALAGFTELGLSFRTSSLWGNRVLIKLWKPASTFVRVDHANG